MYWLPEDVLYVVEPDNGQANAGITIAVLAETVLVGTDAVEVPDDFELTVALVVVETGAVAMTLAPHTLELKTGELRAPFI